MGFVVVAYSSALKKNRNLFGIWKTKFQQKVPLQVQKPLALGSPSVFIYGKKRVKLPRVFKGVRLLEIFVFFFSFAKPITLTTKPEFLHRLPRRAGGGRLSFQLACWFFLRKKESEVVDGLEVPCLCL